MKDAIRAKMEATRERTLWLLAQVSDEYLRRRVHSFYSPIGWHFGHVGCIEDTWVMGEALGEGVLDERLAFLFTDRKDNPKDNRVHIPDRAGILDWLDRTRERSLDALDRASLAGSRLLEDGYAWHFADQHECQHQETIAEMLQLIQREKVSSNRNSKFAFRNSNWGGSSPAPEMVCLPGGTFCMGTDDAFAYDNEMAPHEVAVAPFRLAKTPVSVAQWIAFMNDGGYERRELWSPEGWAWREAESASAPEYWCDEGILGAFGTRQPDPEEPVCSVSWYEADAFARWSGKRLPTEAEWEYAAQAGRYPWGDEEPTPAHANHGLRDWAPMPAGRFPKGATPEGIMGMAGGTWEWTSSRFLPYPGFRAFPYDGYSKDHMKGEHFVLRGGSWATSPGILRRTFRNWYIPGYRQGFLGVRLAEDA